MLAFSKALSKILNNTKKELNNVLPRKMCCGNSKVIGNGSDQSI